MAAPDISVILNNLNDQLPYFLVLIQAFAYLMGFVLIAGGMYKLKQYGDLRTMMSLQTDARGPLYAILVGGGLLFFPSAVELTMKSAFGTTTILSYKAAEGADAKWSEVVRLVTRVIQIVGYIAFLRGMLLLAKVQDKSQQSSFSKAATHMIGGIMCINIIYVKDVFKNTIGL